MAQRRKSRLKDFTGAAEAFGATPDRIRAAGTLDKERPMHGPAAPDMPRRVTLVDPVVAGTKWE
jgi:hypothetical protein